LRRFVLYSDVMARPMLVERTLEASLPWDITLLGRLDRVDRVEDGGLHIIDYKTGNPPHHADWRQLHFHALLVSRCLPYPVVKASYLYLNTGALESISVDDTVLQGVAWDLMRVAKRIREERHFPPNPGGHCRGCDFKVLCPVKTAKAEGHPLSSEGQSRLWQEG
jgi:RecB family exonuclease